MFIYIYMCVCFISAATQSSTVGNPKKKRGTSEYYKYST